MSDLHLEVNQQYSAFKFPVAAPLLVLGGDIGRLVDYELYLSFLARQTSRFDRVFLVLGNHEFFGLDYEAGIEKARKLESEDILGGKLVLLHRNRWDDETSNLTMLGCTLWSKIPPGAEDIVKLRVSDFKQITNWSVEQHNASHSRDLAWLQDTVTLLPPSRVVLVVTHHAPCTKGASRPEHEKNPWSCAFATDIIQRKEFKSVQVWMFGHTHFTTELKRGRTRVVANQRGYGLGVGGPALEKKGSFDEDKVIELRGCTSF